MKKVVGIFVLILFLLSFGFLGFVSTSVDVDVHDVSLKQIYSAFETISGTINLTITDTSFNSEISSSLGSDVVLLGNFLDNNSAAYSCSPSDCSNAYDFDAASDDDEKLINVDSEDGAYFGFVLYENNVQVKNLSFNISSDFGEEVRIPLELQLFEESIWRFSEASNNFGPQLWGCYDPSEVDRQYDIISGDSPYCEKISVLETPSLRVGADLVIESGSSGDVEMKVYNEFKQSLGATCKFNPSNGEEYCDVSPDTGVFSGENYICIKCDSTCAGYQLNSESSGEKCGWYGLPSTEDSIRDYGIFAKPALYASAEDVGEITIDDEKISNLVPDANLFLQNQYNSDCSSSGCVLPVFVKGVSQNLTISGLNLIYSSSGGVSTDNLIYNVDITPAKVDFSGVLDLSLLGFNVGAAKTTNKTLNLYLDGSSLLSEKIAVLPALITINSVSPLSPLAGIAVNFYADVASTNNISSYSWNFGDGKSETTSEKSVVHAYQAVSNYTLTLKVTDVNGSTSSKDFLIKTISPELALNQTFIIKQKRLDNISAQINSLFPVWQQNVLKGIINVSYYDSELKRLKSEWENASTDADFLNVALGLYVLDISISIFVSEQAEYPLINDLDDVDPEMVQAIFGNISGDLSGYKNPILQWQNQNIDATISSKKISLMRESGETEDILIVYSVSVKSISGDESYFVIKKLKRNLIFKSVAIEVKTAGDGTAVVLDAGADKSFEFCYKGSDDIVFFVSPELSSLSVDIEISPCNFNKICEPELGENYKNCRSDCKPWGKMILYIVLVLIFGLIVYTVLQMWYKARYETFLFKDRKYLFNLVMFITNARAKGMDDWQISKELKKKKYWSSEQINYALKKASGKRVGMYEIIPIEKLFVYFRERKAKKNIAARMGTQVPLKNFALAK